MELLSPIAVALAAMALSISVAALIKASSRYAKRVSLRKISDLEVEMVALTDQVEQLKKLTKRQIARENMAKARAAKKENGRMTDEEWRAWATKRIQMGQPID